MDKYFEMVPCVCGTCGRSFGNIKSAYKEKEEQLRLTVTLSIRELLHARDREYLFLLMAYQIVKELKDKCMSMGIE